MIQRLPSSNVVQPSWIMVRQGTLLVEAVLLQHESLNPNTHQSEPFKVYLGDACAAR